MVNICGIIKMVFIIADLFELIYALNNTLR